MLTATIGLIRMPDYYTRMHALTKAATLGISGLLMAAIFEFQAGSITIKVILAILFHFLTNPVGAHMISRAAYYHLKVKFWKNTFAEEWKDAHDS